MPPNVVNRFEPRNNFKIFFLRKSELSIKFKSTAFVGIREGREV